MKKAFLVVWIIFIMQHLSFVADVTEEVDINKIILLINEEKYEEALKLADILPESTEKKLIVSIIHLQTENYDIAEKYLKEIIKEMPESIPARYNLAMLYEKKKEYGLSIAEWEKVLSLSKDKKMKSLAIKHIRQLRGLIK